MFDLGDLRPFASLHAGGGALGMHDGINTLGATNVHTIALQIPKKMLGRWRCTALHDAMTRFTFE